LDDFARRVTTLAMNKPRRLELASRFWSEGDGARYWVRTSDPYRVKMLRASLSDLFPRGQLDMEPCEPMQTSKMLQ